MGNPSIFMISFKIEDRPTDIRNGALQRLPWNGRVSRHRNRAVCGWLGAPAEVREPVALCKPVGL
jgi:hypothetical protein